MSSLSTQLARGTLALPLLVLFGALAMAGERSPSVDPVQAAQAALLERICPIGGGSRTLVLAQAPADLGHLVVRWGRPCRG